MKRPFVFVSLLLLTLVSIVTIYGCGSTSTTSTTGTVMASQSQTAQSGVLIAGGAASIGVAASSTGSMAGSSPAAFSARSTWDNVRAFTGNPPPAFFTLDMTTGTASADGYFNPLATQIVGGKVTPYIRMRNHGSNAIIAGSFFSGKKIAIFPGCSVEAIFAGGPTQAPVGIVSGVGSFMQTWQSTTSNGAHPELLFRMSGDFGISLLKGRGELLRGRRGKPEIALFNRD